jgi:hypothetical protein
MKPTLYLETSIVSYYAGRPSRDLIVAARQQVTRDWWENQRRDFALYVSALVQQESQRGDPADVRKRQRALKGIPLLRITPEAEELAEALMQTGPIPREYPDDALHIAVASTSGMDFLLTWNFRHINNARMKPQVAGIVARFGYEYPVVCTPQELMEADYENVGSDT